MTKADPLSTTSEKKAFVKKVTLVGMVWDFILGISKILIGIFFHSQALIVDGVHSLTDVVSDIFVLIVANLSHEGPDKEHPYGHEKFETIGSVALGSLLIATAGALAYENAGFLYGKAQPVTPGWPTLAIAAFSLVVKEVLFHYTFNAGVRLNSSLIKANAWHSRTDAFSSLIVFIGLIFAQWGWAWMDGVAAIIVSIIIAKIGWGFVSESISELADTGVDEEKRIEIRKVILGIEGVKSCHSLRSRKMGPHVLMDVNIEVDVFLTASEAHEISAWTVKILKEQFDEIKDVTVHIDVEDDREEADSFNHTYEDLLPLRKEIIKELNKVWGEQGVLGQAQALRLHYIKRRIVVELHLPFSEKQSVLSLSLLQNELQEKAKDLPWFSKVKILLKVN